MNPNEWNHHLEEFSPGEDGNIQYVRAEADPGVSNCYNFTIFKEDHTIGNLLTQELLNEDRVLFAGYRIQHPLTDLIIVRVNTSDKINNPEDLVSTTIKNIQSHITLLQTSFKNQVQNRLAKNSEKSRY